MTVKSTNTTMTVPTLRHVVWTALILGCMLSTGCNAPGTQESPPKASSDSTQEDVQVRIAVILDKSGSAPKNRIPPLEASHLKPLIKLVRDRGGDLAVGAVKANSNRPLERLDIDPPPSRPARPDEDMNPFEKTSAMKEYRKKVEDYRTRMERYRQSLDAEVKRFRSGLESLLGAPANAKRSDIRRALVRTELFFEEPTVGDPEVKHFGILMTDGLDNVSESLPEIRSGATYLVVNGTGTLGVLEELGPKRFESPEAAIEFVVRSAR